jgi:hypothetical protein
LTECRIPNFEASDARMPYGGVINTTVCAVEKFSPAKQVTINVR